MKAGVVLPAGGKGLRLGEAMPKQFLELEPGWPLLRYALETFHALDAVAAVVLVLPEAYLSSYAGWLDRYPKLRLAEGGAERWLSVRQGVAALPPECEGVLIHDAARPFVTREQVLACLARVEAGECCTLAMPCSDTIKQVDGGHIEATLDRNRLIAVQTPQGFPRAVLEALYADTERRAAAQGATQAPPTLPTDECMLAEAGGHRVTWVKGGHNIRKVTDAEDLLWAKWMAGRRLNPL